ncbi:MAG: hypothetical protein AAFR88_13585, partial [Pseudomonadota bacterium]
MKLAKLAVLAAATALAPFAAQAQDVGATVFGNDDQPIGTVESNDGATVVVNTGTYKAPLPANLIASREIGFSVNATKAQIDSMMAAQKAEADKKLASALVDGAKVISADNMPVGTVLAMDASADQYLVENETGVITLKREHFAVDQAGALIALFTTQQLAGFTVAVPQGAVVE